jgi:hypothetical protein
MITSSGLEGGIRVPQRYGDLYDTAPRTLRVVMGAIAGLCAATALAHITLVFLHVAPSNPVSQRLQKPIQAWIYPVFEQNWLLFAPNPNTYNTQVFARTGRLTEAGRRETTDWIDISAADVSGTRHNLYPSRTTQTMLRRVWVSYTISHDQNDVPYGDWGLTRAEYLRNIAMQRIRERSTHPFQTIQLKVVTYTIAPPETAGAPAAPAEPFTRTLPWWNATSDGS